MIPDVEEHVTRTLDGIGAVKVWAYHSTTLGVLEATSLQVDARASSKERAEQLAHHARALILALPGQAWHDGIVSSVGNVAGPLWVPDPDGAPRYLLRCTIRYRSTR